MTHEILIETANDLVHARQIAEEEFDGTWFRGVPRSDFALLPQVFRDAHNPKFEALVTGGFRLRARSRYEDCPLDTDHSGWLALMRHYGVPTRLLDWSNSILVAAFFALQEASDQDAAIWALAPTRLNKCFVKFDTSIGMDSDPCQRLCGDALCGKTKAKTVIAAEPPEIDLRMVVQQSRFTIHGDSEPLESIDGARNWLRKFVIPKSQRAVLRRAIKSLGIFRSTLFPDLEHLRDDLVSSAREEAPARRAAEEADPQRPQS